MSAHNRGVAFVTGASRGIGRACAITLARRGFDVAVGYHRNGEAADAVAAAVKSLGKDAYPIALDVRDQRSIRSAVADAAEHLGPIRAVVSNALGLDDPDPSLVGATATEIPWPVYEAMFAARAGALLTLTDATIDTLHDGGAAVAVTSTGAQRCVPGYAAIAAAMTATECLVRYLAADLGARGIRVNCVAGGVIATDALHHLTTTPNRMLERVARATPLGRHGEPTDLADIVGWLCSDDAQWVTGQVITADGGCTLR